VLCLPGDLLVSVIRPASQFPAVLSFGEILWDVIGDREMIGGAPFNVAAHLARLGTRSFLYSRVGGDHRGTRARHHMVRLGVNDRWLQEDNWRPTGWVDVTLDRSGQPTFRIGPDAAWDAIEAPAASTVAELRAERFGAIVCGTLAQRAAASRQALAAIRAALPDVPVFYDVNLRGSETPLERVRETMAGVTILKINREEADAISQGLFGRGCAPRELFAELNRRYGIRLLLSTRGAEGCEVFADGVDFSLRAEPVAVASAVGAGDAFSAAFLAGWVKGLTLETAATNAGILGAFVAASPETVPVYPEELLARMSGLR
jgi:fructokinase